VDLSQKDMHRPNAANVLDTFVPQRRQIKTCTQSLLSRGSVNTTRHGLVASGVMLGALEGQERVNGRHGHRVSGPNANLGTARTIGRLIGDLGAASRHGGCTRDYLGVHPERLGKISGPKCHRNVAHVLPDRDDPSAVGKIVCVKDDPPTIHEVLKNVRRRVLIHAHDSLTARLHGREWLVRSAPRRFAPAPACGDCDHEGEAPTCQAAGGEAGHDDARSESGRP